ncbi:MAG: rod-binding protein [Treponema sp.]|jgi:flagellar protein FlgJ|nr:rod-binding protein [Treponema sp.]
MDIGSLGAAYIDDYRIGGGIVNPKNSAADKTPDFAETLKKTAAAQTGDHSPPSKTVGIDKFDKLYEQCLELEIFLVKSLIGSMRSTVQKSGLVDEGFAGKMYEDMLYDEYARDFTKNANFGLAELAYLELTGQRGKTVVK